jgi:hypothetical protein
MARGALVLSSQPSIGGNLEEDDDKFAGKQR